MPLEAPKLDDRTFEELLREAQLRIPRYTPEWTDFNDSDPGSTLLQLFAWFTELMLYRMNQVPDANYIAFLRLLNIDLQPAQPATAHLTFKPVANAKRVASIPVGFRAAAQSATGDLLIFETERGMDLIRPALTDVVVFDGAGYRQYGQANETPGVTFPPFGWVPQVGNALYLGFKPPETTGNAPLPPQFPTQMRFRVLLPVSATAGKPRRAQDAILPPVAPATLEWEYKPTATATRWQRLNVNADESAAFTREGDILVQGPASIEPSLVEHLGPEARYWIRCRIAGGGYPSGQRLEIDALRPNTVPAINLSTVRDELVGISDGRPDQTLSLRAGNRPIQPDSIRLRIVPPVGDAEDWTRTDDLFASGETSLHFTLRATTGEITFGDGTHGQIPVAGSEIIATEYRFGGGAAGNVPAGGIATMLANAVGIGSVTNERPATGGADEQRLDALKREAPSVLRHRNRAVSADDYQTLAERAGGVARAVALPLAHPDHPEIEVPGAVTVVIIPSSLDPTDRAPTPSADLIRSICRYLEPYRVLTSELFVRGPIYLEIRIVATVEIDPYASPDEIERQVLDALYTFLDPLGRSSRPTAAVIATATAPVVNGNGNGTAEVADTRQRGFGEDLHPTSLYGVILGVAGVRSVPFLQVFVDDQEHDTREPIRVPAGGMVFGSAGHEINAVPAIDR